MATKKPNILILWGDDVGWWNISYNSRGQMGYRTPNIDRVANEGVAFTDYYAQQSCTAGRAASHDSPHLSDRPENVCEERPLV
jgi:arylsulfatase A-like enzyme